MNLALRPKNLFTEQTILIVDARIRRNKAELLDLTALTRATFLNSYSTLIY
jgi:hypothetical protein